MGIVEWLIIKLVVLCIAGVIYGYMTGGKGK